MRPIDADRLTQDIKFYLGSVSYVDPKLLLKRIEEAPTLSNKDMVHLMKLHYENDERIRNGGQVTTVET